MRWKWAKQNKQKAINFVLNVGTFGIAPNILLKANGFAASLALGIRLSAFLQSRYFNASIDYHHCSVVCLCSTCSIAVGACGSFPNAKRAEITGGVQSTGWSMGFVWPAVLPSAIA
jgi:hypothetical protein